MDCRDVEERIETGEALGADARAHLAECEACRGLADAGPELPRALGALSPAAAPIDAVALEAALRGQVAEERGIGARMRSWPRSVRLGVVLGLLALDVAIFGGLWLRRDWAEFPAWRMTFLLGSQTFVLFVATWEAMRPAYRPARSQKETIALVIAAALLPASLALLPELPTPFDFSYGRVGWFCFTIGVAQGVSLLMLVGHLDRSEGALVPFLYALVAAGLLAQIGLTLHCPVNDRWHLLTGHASVPIGLLLGALALRRRTR
jgi:hypothetical protein